MRKKFNLIQTKVRKLATFFICVITYLEHDRYYFNIFYWHSVSIRFAKSIKRYIMVIHWSSKKLKKLLENYKKLQMDYGPKCPKSVSQRMNDLIAAPNYQALPIYTGKHQHSTNQQPPIFSVDVPTGSDWRGKWRILFQPCNPDFDSRNLATMTEICIISFCDPH